MLRRSLPILLLLVACQGRISLAPHLTREQELAPAAVEDRWGAVLDRAAAFESQNAKSRDALWYRTWRAAAMLGVGQVEEGAALLASIQSELSAAAAPPAQVERLRLFLYDQLARAEQLRGRPAAALPHLERALLLANDVSLEGGGPCDRDIKLAGRLHQVEVAAAAAGDGARKDSAHAEQGRALDRWARCLATSDYPGLAPLLTYAKDQGAAASLVVAAATPAPAPAPPPPVAPSPPGRAAPASPPPPVAAPAPPAAPGSHPLTLLKTASARYAPVNPAPYQEGLNVLAPLLKATKKEVTADLVIRTDGDHHALRLTVDKCCSTTEDLLPLIRPTQVFFERVREVSPKVERLLIKGGGFEVLIKREDVLEVFLERLDADGLAARAQRLM